MKFAAAKPPFLTDLKARTPDKIKTFKSFQAAVNRFERRLHTLGVSDPDLEYAFSVQALEDYKNYLALSCGLRGQTVRAQFSALKCFWNSAEKKGWVDAAAEPWSKLTLPKKDAPVRERTNAREVSLLFDAALRHHSERDVAFMTLLLSTFVNTGVRCEEATDIEVGHIDLDEETLEIRHGKGGKSRTLHPPAEWFHAVRSWLTIRAKMGCTHPYLFALGPKRRCSDEKLRTRLNELKAVAGLKGRNGIKPHSLRHFFAKNMENNGAPLEVIQHALGHEGLETTLIYLRSGEENTVDMKRYAAFRAAEVSQSVEAPQPAQVAQPEAVNIVAAPRPVTPCQTETIQDSPPVPLDAPPVKDTFSQPATNATAETSGDAADDQASHAALRRREAPPPRPHKGVPENILTPSVNGPPSRLRRQQFMMNRRYAGRT